MVGGRGRGVGQPQATQDEILAINDEARDRSLQVALLVGLLAALAGIAVAFRMVRLPDPAPATTDHDAGLL